ncbi:FBP domain-containing protein [Amycolatopsis endophytica]|uniref:FBP domain-containing protein n=1 Tax=Amycolatopsis endophytica TaxID=860233 RepID=UPI0028AF205B|nr:FBP domain-containing protein [Amycolatopsis endophytica]
MARERIITTVRPLDENRIRGSFINCSKGEARRLTLPRLTEIDWSEVDFLGWRDPKAAHNAYLVTPRGGEVIGVALRAAEKHRSAVKQSMCAFCGTIHAATDVTLFAARRAGAAGRLGNTVGTYACADLACGLYLRGKRRPAVHNPVDRAPLEQRIERTLDNLARFLDEVTTDNAR